MPLSVQAGPLIPPGPPGEPASAMYSLQDICNRLEEGTAGIKKSFFGPSSGPGSTNCTLNEMMNKAPIIEQNNGAQPTDVIKGKKYWGLSSNNWGQQTGTFIAVDTTSGDAITSDLKVGKKAWVDGIEIIGSSTAVETKSGDAIASDLQSGKKAWVDGIEIIGTSTAVDTSSDPNLIPSNIREGVTLFGVVGTFNPSTSPEVAANSGARYVDNGDGTVTDTRSNLLWLKNSNCFDEQTWDDAMQIAANLANGQCGLSDASTAGTWRLPTKIEWQLMIDDRYTNPVISNAAGTGKWTEGDAFTGVVSDWYWDSTAYDTNYAWNVHLNDGYVNFGNKRYANYVWPVRDGQ